jgi:beta-N-acetylglucosaminidase
MKKNILFVFIILNGINLLQAQNDSIKNLVTLEKLDFMIGEWEGTGWMMTRSGKENAKIIEKVEYKLEKGIMVVEGLGTKIDSITNEKKIVHNAFGIVFFDSKTNYLTIDAYKNGESTQSKIEFIKDKIIQWNMEIPNQGKVRFTVDFSTEKKWVEIGEFSRDGENWMKFLDLNLDKIEQ